MQHEWYLVGTSIAMAIITGVYFTINLRFQHKANKRVGLLDRFNRFNEKESKEARCIIVNSNYTPEGNFLGSDDAFIKFKKELGELDTTAHLIRKGYIDKNDFLELIGAIIIVCFCKSKPYIDFVRDKRDQKESKYYGKQFEWLAGEAENWWKKKVSEKLPGPDDF